MDENLKNSEDKVSFVVPVYQTEKYLNNCVQSLLQQDYTNLEVIPVLDGKSDKAKRILQKLRRSDSRVKKPVEIQHSGVQRARNVGYEHTTGKFCSFWDSDCYAEPGMVRMWIKVFNKHSDIDFVYSGYRFNDENLTYYPSEPFNPYLLTCGNYIATMFPMRREIFPGFDENIKSLQDWDMWLTVVNKGHKGYFLEGSAFQTEMKKGISSEGCHPDNWLERYEAVRNKHRINHRDICFTSSMHKFRGIEIAEMVGQDWQDMPSYHPHRYKLIYLIGFYPATMQNDSAVFKGSSEGCKKIIHWTGMDAETMFMVPYRAVKELVKMLNKTITKHYVENIQAQQMLKELGIESEIKMLPMKYLDDVKKPEEFKIYYENDNITDELVKSIINACPDIKFENPDACLLRDYACFMSFTGSIMPSENLKRFIMAGRPVITNYDMLYAGKIEMNKEQIVRKIREYKSNWDKYKPNEKAMLYYQQAVNPVDFGRELLDYAKA